MASQKEFTPGNYSQQPSLSIIILQISQLDNPQYCPYWPSLRITTVLMDRHHERLLQTICRLAVSTAMNIWGNQSTLPNIGEDKTCSKTPTKWLLLTIPHDQIRLWPWPPLALAIRDSAKSHCNTSSCVCTCPSAVATPSCWKKLWSSCGPNETPIVVVSHSRKNIDCNW